MIDHERFILWGSSGQAKVLADLIREQSGKVVALFDNSPEAVSSIQGVPLWYGNRGLLEWITLNKDQGVFSAAVAIGGARGFDRTLITNLLREKGFRVPNLIHNRAYLAPSVVLGDANQILAHSTIASQVTVGNACIINHNANVDHECRIGNGVHIAPGATLCGCVTVDDFTMIGANAVVLPRINIGKNSIVGAGAVVLHDVPDSSVVVGNPARIIQS
jgi:sugar O-acyltransferase (sialic acid O-acetyltransferase NeuD family)